MASPYWNSLQNMRIPKRTCSCLVAFTVAGEPAILAAIRPHWGWKNEEKSDGNIMVYSWFSWDISCYTMFFLFSLSLLLQLQCPVSLAPQMRQVRVDSIPSMVWVKWTLCKVKQEIAFALWDFCVEVAEAASVIWLAVVFVKKRCSFSLSISH